MAARRLGIVAQGCDLRRARHDLLDLTRNTAHGVINMTVLVRNIGLLPLALYNGVPGNEIEGSMAMVILDSLITSTVLNRLVPSILALRFWRFDKNAGDLIAMGIRSIGKL